MRDREAEVSSTLHDLRSRVDRLQQLWYEVSRTNIGSPQFDVLIDQIRADSDIYRSILYELWRRDIARDEKRA